MDYTDQLVLTGALNDVGAPLRANVGSSYRLGLEIDTRMPISTKWIWQPNLALSFNRNRDFVFQRDGQLEELGDTRIAYSPGIVAGNAIFFIPNKAWQCNILTKFVGEQYMGNIDSPVSILDAYTQTDLNVQFTLRPKRFVKELVFSALINNIFDAEFESNGYFFTFDDDFSNPGTITTIEGAGYYPQSGINGLIGITAVF